MKARTIHKPAAELRLRGPLLMALTVSPGAIHAISFLAFRKAFMAFMTDCWRVASPCGASLCWRFPESGVWSRR